jgi:hypothetical protein
MSAEEMAGFGNQTWSTPYFYIYLPHFKIISWLKDAEDRLSVAIMGFSDLKCLV